MEIYRNKYVENTQKIYQNWAPDVSSTQYQLSTLGSQGHNLSISFRGREEIYFFPTIERVKMYGALSRFFERRFKNPCSLDTIIVGAKLRNV